MCMVLSSAVIATLLIMNSGCLLFYKTKLTHVNYLAAAYAAAHDGDNDLNQETIEFTKSAMTDMNLIPNNLQVTVKTLQLQENSAVQVTIANDFPIAGVSNGTTPSTIKLEDTELASH